MIKIPTLFTKVFDDKGNYLGVKDEWNKEIEQLEAHLANNWANVVPTVKYDGTACLVVNGKIYRRWDNKKHKKVPDGALFCDAHVEGHEIWWVPCREDNPNDKYHLKAFVDEPNGTYELVGKHFQNNPYNLEEDVLIQHGFLGRIILSDINYKNVYEWVKKHNEEGLVFWTIDNNDNLLAPIAKIRRKDFGLEWPMKEDK